ncbi:hypothetical protein CLOM_g24495 [Closterium sp. NIES-68]|nr:hypothetical protein CLOM_g24495 [Closterium sp. NIES-68]GJP75490.1 hypothetical protein CLOP_g5932 [Closterium sp. NIES-67]
MMRLCLPTPFLSLTEDHDDSQFPPPTDIPSHSLSRDGNLGCPHRKLPSPAAAAPPSELPSSGDTSPRDRRDDATQQVAGWAAACHKRGASVETDRASLDARQSLPPRPSGRFSLEESCCGNRRGYDNLCFRGLEAFPGEPTRLSDDSPRAMLRSSMIPRAMSSITPISAGISPSESAGCPSRSQTWGSFRDASCSQSQGTGNNTEFREPVGRSASYPNCCSRRSVSHRHSLESALSGFTLIEQPPPLTRHVSLHADPLRAANLSGPCHVLGDSICRECSWRAAELACSPTWVDSARSRIQEAALAVVETQQAAMELSARIDGTEGSAKGGHAAGDHQATGFRVQCRMPTFRASRRSLDSMVSWRSWTLQKVGEDQALGKGSPTIIDRTTSQGACITPLLAKLLNGAKLGMTKGPTTKG